jgi:hypothetical protein
LAEQLVLLEDILYVVGAFMGFSIAWIARRGYSETRSPTLLRMALSFGLLGSAFLFSWIAGTILTVNIEALTFTVSTLIIAAAGLETLGYFFLALSHMLNARVPGRAFFMPAILPLGTGATALLRSLSFIFLLYGSVETIISYAKSRHGGTLLIALGLALLGFGELIRWQGFLYPADSVVMIASLVVKILGLGALLLPVVQFTAARRKAA